MDKNGRRAIIKTPLKRRSYFCTNGRWHLHLNGLQNGPLVCSVRQTQHQTSRSVFVVLLNFGIPFWVAGYAGIFSKLSVKLFIRRFKVFLYLVLFSHSIHLPVHMQYHHPLQGFGPEK